MNYVRAAVTGGSAALLLYLPSEISRFVAAICLAVILGEVIFPHLVTIFRYDMESRKIRQQYYDEIPK